MSDQTYVDPNSGAAPQPGGYVGPEGASKGFAGAELGNVKKETAPAFYEVPNVPDNNGALSVPEEDVEKNDLQRALSEPKKVLADLGDEDVKVAEPGAEAKAADDASVEHQGVDPLGQAEEDGDEEKKAPAKKTAAKKAASSSK